MPIKVACSKCGKKLSAPDRLAGKQAKCPQCGTPVNVPAATEIAAAELVAEDPLGPFGGGLEQFAFPQTPVAPFPGTPSYAPPPMGGLGSAPSYNATTRMLLPVGRSGLAIAAGYMGLSAMLCFPAPLAIALGLLAIRDIKMHPEKHGMGRAIFGLVMGVIFCMPCLWIIWTKLLD